MLLFPRGDFTDLYFFNESIKDDITGLVFGENCSTLGTCSRDSTVRLYGDSEEAAAMES